MPLCKTCFQYEMPDSIRTLPVKTWPMFHQNSFGLFFYLTYTLPQQLLCKKTLKPTPIMPLSHPVCHFSAASSMACARKKDWMPSLLLFLIFILSLAWKTALIFPTPNCDMSPFFSLQSALLLCFFVCNPTEAVWATKEQKEPQQGAPG